MKKDLQAWLYFLHNFNGIWMWLEDKWTSASTLNLFTDAASSIGFGALFGQHWLYGFWPTNWKAYNIATLELFPIVLSVELFGLAMESKCILFNTDNQALVSVINNRTCKDRVTMVLVRRLVCTAPVITLTLKLPSFLAKTMYSAIYFLVARSPNSDKEHPWQPTEQRPTHHSRHP